MIAPDVQEKVLRPKQLRLLEVGNPLTARFGAPFFLQLPRQPGVYFFHDAGGRLLYIGQSCDLRARIGSYRHVTPERHPRRTLRLVHRIARIEFTLCESHPAAQELEASLLLERRPPFNRAGVWRPPPWWLMLHVTGDVLAARLARAALPEGQSIGPLPSSFRFVYSALFRGVLRLLNPHLGLGGFPVGWLDLSLPLALHLRLAPNQRHLPELIGGFVSGRCERLFTDLQTALAPGNFATLSEQSFWLEQLDTMDHFRTKKRVLNSDPAPPPGLSPAQATFF